jgi:hypothetical protein
MTTTRTIIAAQPEFEVIMAPSPVKWPVVAWCIEDNGYEGRADHDG